jgi:predicted SAM-dependent methyltransferase
MLKSFLKWVLEKLRFSEGPLVELRHELHLLLLRIRNRVDPIKLFQLYKLRARKDIKLHFGCGHRILQGWVNVDAYYVENIDYVADLRSKLRLPENSVKYVFSEHVFEHFYRDDAITILKNLRSVMIEGAEIRLIVPDLDFYCSNYVMGDHKTMVIPVPDTSNCCASINNVFYGHFHKYMYDFSSLRALLEIAGFSDIQQTKYGKSENPSLVMDSQLESREIGSLCVDARNRRASLQT